MDENIFRAYDIRGIYDKELDDNTAYYIGVAFGEEVKSEGYNKAIVGYDNRMSSVALNKSLVNGITDTGVNVISIGLTTTPMFSYTREYLDIPSGIMVTASHSPADYNGMKVYYNKNGRIYGEIIQAFKEKVKEVFNNFKPINIKGNVEYFDIKGPYINMLKEKIVLGPRKIKVVIDCGNASGSIIGPEVFEKIGCEVIPLYCEPDSRFPNHHPDPAVEENMEALKAKVVQEQADLGLGFDGDADRVGVVNENGRMVYGDMCMAIICRDLVPRLADKKILLDIKCSKSLEDDIIRLGGNPIFSHTGHPYMIKKMREENIPFGGELSGHFYFNDEFYGYDDGIYAGLRLIRILSNTNRPFSSLLEGINTYHSTPEILVKVTDDTKFIFVDKVTEYAKGKNYNIVTIDGVRVNFSDGWALIRASNTGPNITMRFEANSEERLTSIKNEFESILNTIIENYTK